MRRQLDKTIAFHKMVAYGIAVNASKLIYLFIYLPLNCFEFLPNAVIPISSETCYFSAIIW